MKRLASYIDHDCLEALIPHKNWEQIRCRTLDAVIEVLAKFPRDDDHELIVVLLADPGLQGIVDWWVAGVTQLLPGPLLEEHLRVLWCPSAESRNMAVNLRGEPKGVRAIGGANSLALSWPFLRHELILGLARLLHGGQSKTGYSGIDSRIAGLEEEARRADQANKAKSQFLATMSHEIRTPMNGVIGMLDLLLGGNLGDEEKRWAQIAKSSGKALLSLIDDILDFSKIEAGKLALEHIDFHLRTIIDETLGVFLVKAREKGLSLDLELEGDIPFHVRGDPGRLRQILVNLVGNAIKFTSTGNVRLGVRAKSPDSMTMQLAPNQPSSILCFEVHDTGPGVNPEQRERLFKPFSQADGSTTRIYGGTGLGLSISAELVGLMGGSIGYREGDHAGGMPGSVFWFCVPLEIREAGRVQTLPRSNLSEVRVLLAVEAENDHALLSGFLPSLGCEVIDCPHADQLFDILDSVHSKGSLHDILVLDHGLKDNQGISLYEILKETPRYRELPVILLAAPGNYVNLLRLNYGATQVLFKPLAQEAFHHALEKLSGILGEVPSAEPEPEETRALETAGRILLVEDNITNQLVARKLLERRGLSCEVAQNGQEALEMMKVRSYDVVFMDCQMPLMDGYEATAAIRKGLAGEDHRHVPIVAMTANAMRGDRERCLDAGMDGFLAKPLSTEDLDRMLQQLTGKIRRADASEREAIRDLQSVSMSIGGATMGSEQIRRVFDTDELARRGLDDPDVRKIILEGFLLDMPRQMDVLQMAARDGNPAGVQMQAHRIKGAAANISAHEVQEAASALEQALKDDQGALGLPASAQLQEDLAKAMGRLLSLLQDYLKSQ